MTDPRAARLSQVQAFIETTLLRGRAVARDEELLLSGLLDSLAVMALVAEVERIAGRPVPPTDVLIENFTTLDAIGAYMDRQDSA
ncbi:MULTISPECIES: phosphopantetheine-binding protein [unclassified Meridianimarinicoccus]|uniref:phosphopantetheine-binding protein n=1 Tax=unclassified Meridianimarinicoccus TaxID=2923344 RepID=UPI001868E7ED|nr:phosphopantetheine-binding protein [Fluviibacterium sp. MJW13]